MTDLAVVVGSDGLVGSTLVDLLSTGTKRVSTINRSNHPLDLTVDQLARLIGERPVVFNALAYTNVEKAESQEQEATRINGQFVGQLAAACNKAGSKLVHISSDYVFDGEATKPYTVHSTPNPKTAYGRSKLAGEQQALEVSNSCAIVRTAWLYGARGTNFVKTIAGKLRDGQRVEVVNDQIGSPTFVNDLARVLKSCGELEDVQGVVHATSSGSCSWFEFANSIARTLGLERSRLVQPVLSNSYGLLTARPAYSVLENSLGPWSPIGHWESRWQASHKAVLGGV